MNIAIKALKVTFMKICNVQTKVPQIVAGLLIFLWHLVTLHHKYALLRYR